MVGGAIQVAGDAALNVSFASMADNVTGDPLSAALHNVVGTVNVKNCFIASTTDGSGSARPNCGGLALLPGSVAIPRSD